jgi:hypothetical protein
MRYFFHLRSQKDIIPDAEGIVIEDAKSVRSAVLKALTEISTQIPEVLEHLSDWRVVVSTSSEEVVSFPLGEISLATAERSLGRRVGVEDWRQLADTAELGQRRAMSLA